MFPLTLFPILGVFPLLFAVMYFLQLFVLFRYCVLLKLKGILFSECFSFVIFNILLRLFKLESLSERTQVIGNQATDNNVSDILSYVDTEVAHQVVQSRPQYYQKLEE